MAEKPLPPGTESPEDAGLVTQAPQAARENQERAKEGQG
jgi:hypothetical protein